NGIIVPFDRQRIENAIYAAARAVGNGEGRPWAEALSWAVVGILEDRYKLNGHVPHVEEVQDLVEVVLIKSGNPQVAKKYILYRYEQNKAREAEHTLLDADRLVDDYIQRADWRVNENSNMNYSLQGLNSYLSSSIAARYWLHKIYPSEVQKAHVDGDLHLHDLGMLSVYCCGWDLHDLLIQGFGGVTAKIESKPPKHLRTALGQLVNFFYTLQGESAGAVAVSNFDTLLAPFIRYDDLDYRAVKQAMQEFVFNINVPTRTGFQTPFTNVTMDLNPPSTLRDLPVIIGGEMQQETYGEFQREMDIFNRAFAEVMLEGDAKGRVFTFPIPTYNITRDFDWDNAELEPIWAMTARYGIPYFCLEENTPVLLSDYTSVPIKEVRVGTSLVDQDGSPVLVTAVHRSSSSEIVRITQGNGQVLLATPTHRFPTDTELKEAKYLSLGDNLIRSIPQMVRLGTLNATVPEKELDEFFDIYTIFDNLEATPVSPGDLLPGQTVVIRPKPFPAESPRIRFDHQANRYDSNRQVTNLPERLTPDMCRMLGYLVGDGYYAKENSRITFVSMDEATLRDYTDMLESLGVNYRISQAGKSQVAKEVSSHSVELREFLLQLGLHRVTARSKSVPWVIFRCPEEHVANFVRGLFDADASVGKRRLIAFTSTSGILAGQVQLLLLRMGIASHLSRTKRNYKITITGNNVHLYAQKVGSANRVKRERLEKHSVDNSHKSLGDPLLRTQEQVEKLVAEGYLPYHYRRGSTYRGYYRVPSIALNHIMPGNTPITGDYVAERLEARSELEPIVELQLIKGDFTVVDATVESDSHLFTLHDGILSHNSNFINSDMSPDDTRSMCCRLRLDQRELRKRVGGLFAAAPLTGSVGVVTINMSRLGHLAQTEAEFLERLEGLMEIARTSLEIKRNILEQFTERGLYPYCRHYLRGIKQRTGSYWGNHFSTIGLLGMNEASENLFGVNIAHPDGKAFAIRTLKFMREVLACFQEETGSLYNLEATPAEGASFRLARADRQHFSDIVTGGTNETPYYTNSTQLPVSYTDDLFEALEHQDDLQTLYTGGTVLHVFQGEQLDDWRQARRLVRIIAERFHLPYYSLTPTFSICPVHGYISGKHEYCPHEHSEEELARFGRRVGD
ncbi:MAG: ribonucleoside-triphosphate reductase, partial [Anaerolineae bacterium]|nr:ribonucleoside-triphosphate reductase [Anaerolineae bacterium]